MTTASARPRRLTAQQLRRTTYELELRPGWTIALRRSSMMTLLLSGKLPLPLLAAFGQLQRLSTSRALAESDPTERELMLEALRWYACSVVADPVVVMTDDGNPDHVPVEVFTAEELFAIGYADPPADVVEDPTAPEPVVTEDDLARFPGSGGGDATDVAPPTGEDVRPTPVAVAAAAVDLVHG